MYPLVIVLNFTLENSRAEPDPRPIRFARNPRFLRIFLHRFFSGGTEKSTKTNMETWRCNVGGSCFSLEPRGYFLKVPAVRFQGGSFCMFLCFLLVDFCALNDNMSSVDSKAIQKKHAGLQEETC